MDVFSDDITDELVLNKFANRLVQSGKLNLQSIYIHSIMYEKLKVEWIYAMQLLATMSKKINLDGFNLTFDTVSKTLKKTKRID